MQILDRFLGASASGLLHRFPSQDCHGRCCALRFDFLRFFLNVEVEALSGPVKVLSFSNEAIGVSVSTEKTPLSTESSIVEETYW